MIPIAAGEPLCEVETDKSALEVESPASGTLLDVFFDEGEEVAVQVNIAAIGEPGEDISNLKPAVTADTSPEDKSSVTSDEPVQAVPTQPATLEVPQRRSSKPDRLKRRISPRAASLAEELGVDISAIRGSGPGGRIIERDVRAAPPTALKPAAVQTRITPPIQIELPPGEAQTAPLQGTRKIIAERMLYSIQSTAQLTLNASADARALLSFRQRLKSSAEAFDLQNVTINDFILFTVSRTLPDHPELNARAPQGGYFTIRKCASRFCGGYASLPDGARHSGRQPLKSESDFPRSETVDGCMFRRGHLSR